ARGDRRMADESKGVLGHLPPLPRKALNNSVIGMEQAYRQRKGLPLLSDTDIEALKAGEPMPWERGDGGSSTATTVATSVPAAPGASKAAAAGGVASIGPEASEINRGLRRFPWTAVAAFLASWFLAFFRFFLPRTLFEPATIIKVGYKADYGLGVDTKWQQKYRIWVDRTPDRIFVIYARCTHLGCTPDWKPSENKFKCPCHGSGYDSEGVNFEGPAPRPMDRAHVEGAPAGQILADVS